jgi:energy-coupling factor transporter ATP-binding protein EcfA2
LPHPYTSSPAEDASASTTQTGASHLLFLSHAGIDSEAALRLSRRLEESNEAQVHGLRVWIDKVDLGAGGRWKDALQSALASSTAFAVYIGSRGVVNWVWDEVSVALDRAHKESHYPLVPILASGTTDANLPSFLSQYQGVGGTDQPEEFQKLLRAVLRLEPRAVVAAERDPFIGLQAYDSRRAHLFFGREQEINELVALLRQTPFVLVTGDSGSGKSSLVLAGLVPAFRGGRLGRLPEEGPDETIWHVIETRPGSDPFPRLADSVRAAAERTGTRPREASELADLVRTRQPDKVRDAVLSGAPKDPQRPSKILLVVDQFEEFRTSPHATVYVTALLRLATPGDDQIRVVLTMRRDYYYTCDSFPDLRERLQGSTPSVRYPLRRMSNEGLRASITKPLKLAGIDQRHREDLAEAVLKDIGDEPGELALLQMALWRTWSEAKRRGPDLVRAYNTIGRVEGALAQAAEGVFERLPPAEQQRAEMLFVRLVRPGEAGGATRRVVRLNEFDGPTRALAEKLSQQEQWRLLTSASTRWRSPTSSSPRSGSVTSAGSPTSPLTRSMAFRLTCAAMTCASCSR